MAEYVLQVRRDDRERPDPQLAYGPADLNAS